MKTFAFTCLLMLACPVLGQDPSTMTTSRSGFETGPQWNLDPAYWDRLLAEQRESPLRLGRSDLVLHGPLIEGLRPRRTSGDLTLAQKMARFPVIRLFILQPISTPPEGSGRYFAWRSESTRPWTSVSTSGGAAAGAYDPMRHEAGGLISVSW